MALGVASRSKTAVTLRQTDKALDKVRFDASTSRAAPLAMQEVEHYRALL